MSLKLHRVELINIRSHEHIVFEPELTGITAIQGVNGAGKSTIVDSIAWALFGVKPKGVAKSAEIFRNGIGEKDKALARVDLEVDGRLLRFERRRVNKHGTLECEVFAVEKKKDGEVLTRLAGPAVSHAETYIRKTLRMDKQGFLSSILVQQKQVDQLISADPPERGLVIEKLTGIAGVTAALVQSRQDFKALKKAASFSSIDEAGLKTLTIEEQEVRKAAEALREKLELMKAEASELKATGEKLKLTLHEATENYERKSSIERKIATCETTLSLKREALDETSKTKETERKAISGFSSTQHDELSVKLSELNKERDSLKIKASRMADRVKDLHSEEQTLKSKLSETPEASEGTIEDFEVKLKSLTEQIAKNTQLVNDAKNQQQQIESAIAVIEHGQACPTCLQTVADPTPAVKALQATVSALKKTQVESSTQVTEAQAEKASTLASIDDLTFRLKAEARLDEIIGEASSSKKKLDAWQSDLNVLENELKSLNKVFDEAKKHRDRQQAYKLLLTKAQKLTEEVEGLEFQIKKLKQEDSQLESGSQRSVNALQKKLDELRAKHSSVSINFTKNKGELEMKIQKLQFLGSEIKRHEEDIAKHKELLKSVAVASHSVEIVSEFREERIRNSIVSIEVYASDLLSRFTDGKFTMLKLDEKFNATVYLADGTPRSVGLLSGGELSAAAMSLRLAIAMLLNSGADQNTMILDEVLVSQDGARAELILATIKEMFQGQVILIAHNESIEAIADKIVSLKAK